MTIIVMSDDNFKLKDDKSNEVKLLSANKCLSMVAKYELQIRTLNLGNGRLHQVYLGDNSLFYKVCETNFNLSLRKAISEWIQQKDKRNWSYNE